MLILATIRPRQCLFLHTWETKKIVEYFKQNQGILLLKTEIVFRIMNLFKKELFVNQLHTLLHVLETLCKCEYMVSIYVFKKVIKIMFIKFKNLKK